MSLSSILIKEMCMAGRATANAGAVITPGVLLMRTSIGVIPFNKIFGNGQRMFALEKDGQSIDVNYAIGEAVNYKLCRSGDQVYSFLTAGSSAEVGSYLGSAGNGCLIRLSDNPEGPALAVALEEIEATMVTRILVEIM